jgi:hypothetical protein
MIGNRKTNLDQSMLKCLNGTVIVVCAQQVGRVILVVGRKSTEFAAFTLQPGNNPDRERHDQIKEIGICYRHVDVNNACGAKCAGPSHVQPLQERFAISLRLQRLNRLRRALGGANTQRGI